MQELSPRSLLRVVMACAFFIAMSGWSLATSASAHKPKTAHATQPRILYSAIKVAAHDVFQRAYPASELRAEHVELDPGKLAVDLGHLRCGDATQYLGVPEKSPILTAATIAFDAEYMKAQLRLWHVPSAVYEGTFAKMDALAIASIEERKHVIVDKDPLFAETEALGRRLARDATRYATTKSGMPIFVYWGECGDGGSMTVTVKTVPPGAIVKLIALFNYKVCQALKRDPDDPQKCDGWLTAANTLLNDGGIYRYVAIWADGQSRSGNVEAYDGIITIKK